jgi:hypothetical protein
MLGERGLKTEVRLPDIMSGLATSRGRLRTAAFLPCHSHRGPQDQGWVRAPLALGFANTRRRERACGSRRWMTRAGEGAGFIRNPGDVGEPGRLGAQP